MLAIFEKFISMFYPARCPLCGRLAAPGAELCENCSENLPRARLRTNGFFIAPFYYEGPVKAAIIRLKFRGDRSPAPFFARAAAQKLRDSGERRFDFVTAVPLSRREMKKRGYNQSEIVARLLARELSLPYRAALKKIRDIPPQRTLSAAQRRENILGAFAAEGDAAGRRILVVDDITTTGSTLAECVRVLKAAGAGSAEGLAVASVREGKIRF